MSKTTIKKTDLIDENFLGVNSPIYHAIFDNANICLLIAEPTSNILECNKCFCALLGLEKEEIIGGSLTNLLHKDDRSFFQKQIDNLQMEKLNSFAVEKRFIKKDGSSTVCIIKVNRTQQEKEGLLMIAVEEICEGNKKKIERERLIESESNYRSFFNKVEDLLFVINDKLTILEVNDTAIERLGYSKKELLGISLINMVANESKRKAEELFYENSEKKEEQSLITLISKNDELIPVETKVSGGYWNNQKVFYFVNKDVSRLKLSEDKLSKVFHVNPAICAIIDLYKDRIVEVNNTFFRKLKYTPKQLEKGSASKILELSENLKVSGLEELKKHNRISHIDMYLPTADGSSIPVIGFGETLELKGKKYLYAVAIDISEQKKADFKLKRSELLLKEAQDLAKVGYYTYDFTSDKLICTDTLNEILGFNEPILKNLKLLYKIIHPEQRLSIMKQLRNDVVLNGKDLHTECKIIAHNNNKIKWVLVRGVIKYGISNKPSKIIGTIQDITERKTTELKLVRSENALKAIIRSTMDKGEQNFFDSLTESLNNIAKADYTYIGRISENNKAYTISMYSSDGKLENLSFDLKSSPCSSLSKKKTCVFKKDVLKLFPENELLKKLDIEAYIGTPVFAHSGKAIGMIVSLFKTPIEEEGFISSIFEICSSSVGSEIERTETSVLIKENEKLLNTIFENAPVLMILLNEDGEVVKMNREGLDINDFIKPEIIGQRSGSLLNCINHLTHEKGCGYQKGCADCVIRNSFRQTLQSGLSVIKEEAEFTINFDGKKSNHTFLVSTSRIAKGEKYNVLLTLDDITHRKEMEWRIFESELTLNKIFNHAPIIMLLVDKTGKIVKINKTARESSYEPSTTQSYTCKSIFGCIGESSEDSSMGDSELCRNCVVRNTLSDTFRTGREIYKLEADIITHRDSEIILKTYLVSSSLIERGENARALLTFDDITEQKRTEEELILSKEKSVYNEKRYRLLSNLTFEGIMIHQDRKILDVNRALLKISGFSYSELIGQDSIELLFPASVKNAFEGNLLDDLILPIETELISKKGERIPIEIESRFFKQNDQRIKVSAIRDITERKEGEKKILQAVMTAEEDERSRFAQELHDGLGPILSNVQMYFQWLAEEDENKEFVITKGEQSLKNAFAALRELSNKLSPHILQNFGITHALNNFIESLATKKIRIDFKTNLETYRFSTEIEITLYRTITELINNSLKYSGAGKIRLEMFLNEDYLISTYNDDGKGFDMTQVEKKGKGFGLLNIKNRIKTIHGDLVIKTGISQGFRAIIKIKIPKDSLLPNEK